MLRADIVSTHASTKDTSSNLQRLTPAKIKKRLSAICYCLLHYSQGSLYARLLNHSSLHAFIS